MIVRLLDTVHNRAILSRYLTTLQVLPVEFAKIMWSRNCILYLACASTPPRRLIRYWHLITFLYKSQWFTEYLHGLHSCFIAVFVSAVLVTEQFLVIGS
jgi:hypothetical protein